MENLKDKNDKSLNNKTGLPQPNEILYLVKGHGDKKSKMFKNFDEAKAYAIKTDKFLFQMNSSDYYDEKLEFKSLKLIDLTKETSASLAKFYVIESIFSWSNYSLKENIVFVGSKKECCKIEKSFKNKLLKKSKSSELLNRYYTISEKEWDEYLEKLTSM